MHTSGSHLSKDMLELIKSIGDSRSKQEEDKTIVKEVEVEKYQKDPVKKGPVTKRSCIKKFLYQKDPVIKRSCNKKILL